MVGYLLARVAEQNLLNQKTDVTNDHEIIITFFSRFFYWVFLTHIKYNYSNWVWPCWESLAGARTRASVVAACNLTSFDRGLEKCDLMQYFSYGR